MIYKINIVNHINIRKSKTRIMLKNFDNLYMFFGVLLQD